MYIVMRFSRLKVFRCHGIDHPRRSCSLLECTRHDSSSRTRLLSLSETWPWTWTQYSS